MVNIMIAEVIARGGVVKDMTQYNYQSVNVYKYSNSNA